MPDRLLAHVRANAIAYLALFVALGGVSWAASAPLRDKAESVKSSNIADGTIKARDLAPTRGLPPNPQPPADGDYTGDWSDGAGGELKVTYEDKGINSMTFTQNPSGTDPPCLGIFERPTVKTVGTQQYFTATNPNGQNIQLHIQWNYQARFEVLQGTLTQSRAPNTCTVPSGTDMTT